MCMQLTLMYDEIYMIQKFEKASHKFVELVKTNLMIYNTLHFDQ